ncbi:transcriptional regulator, TetR family [Streptoalloteichus tenebrarius]|uniref:Transcriptional regulator, TetR family n=1 Tax=Streptoalloteichus tenebrarius (strain ATCC 17920 / DSM 40477 / JCM 4838 / CBS 697.72 / NBRC 16177 / NCIMB 11028 / NRRL B-12390 / A12253. 1 / ISP 5477) TaxID=1933 RepID=A0ABT1HTR0_STRSD|nr:TetR/AcrR family transcriptional regulator C-terminal domain-containing protein [Streptoalloteichus tenebrarius]MCP2258897.1 transcriptional regulator, TetR family [Streptoalloteichus tenebrarius]BFE99416.1 GntR family transcriptional regulator [Streptoalloteichus tenebrarius]
MPAASNPTERSERPGPPEPPYLRIVAEIRRRVTDGELAPGDPVPSVRQIAREWGVAHATATKALNTLRQQGVVRAEPRVGTVVAEGVHRPTAANTPTAAGSPAPRRAPAAEPELTRDRVVRAAIEIADAEGLAGLSMRVVAARLGVATMSLYRHVDGKDDLVQLMIDAVYGELRHPEPPPSGWRRRLEVGARELWALHRRHPWLAQPHVLTRPLPLPNIIRAAEWMLAALDGLGLDPTTMVDLHVLVHSFVQGLGANLEHEAQAAAVTGLTEDEWMDRQLPAFADLVATGRYPVFGSVLRAFARTGYDLDLDTVFELGLRALLDGHARVIEERAGQRTRRHSSE